MLVLGLETSGEMGSVGVINSEEALAEISFAAILKHGEKLLPAVQSALDLAEVEREEIELIAVATGPGSFTGLRIGLATAKGLSEALGTPIVGIPSADVYARATRFSGHDPDCRQSPHPGKRRKRRSGRATSLRL